MIRFTAVLFTIAQIWTQPKCPLVDEWIKKTVVHLHNGILHSRKKGAPSLPNSMDGTGEHYAKTQGCLLYTSDAADETSTV